MADRLRTDVAKGKLTWAEAVQQAQQIQNLLNDAIRARCTPVGRTLAQRLKAEKYSLNQLIARQSRKLYGDTRLFSRLPEAKQNAIYAGIVTSAGKSNPAVTRAMARLSYACVTVGAFVGGALAAFSTGWIW